MEIRLLREPDTQEFWDLRLRALQEEPEAFAATFEEEVTKTVETVANRFREVWSSEENFILGAFTNGKLVGCVGFYREQRVKLRHKGNLWGMYVVPDARRKGVGRLLMEAIIEKSS